MSKLAPDLFERRFDDFVEIARARLPSLAPEWTDHNAHDPGITLIELLAWVAEAQLYSLSRVRRDERTAYATLLGIAAAGTRGAEGLIWRDRRDRDSPFAMFPRSVVIPADAVINVMGVDSPTFRPPYALLWAPGQIETLETRSGRGRSVDHTRVNERGEHYFLPFGNGGGRREKLVMTFKCRDEAGLFGKQPEIARGALWPIGVLVAPSPAAVFQPAAIDQACCSPLTATLVTDDDSFDVPIAADTTRGLFATGVLLLDLKNVKDSPERPLKRFRIELRSPGGFPRPPQVRRIEPNVIPIRQGRDVAREQHHGPGSPDWTIRLLERGLRFAGGAEPVDVEGIEPTKTTSWRRTNDLSEHGPQDDVYEFDAKSGELTFGNGVNGRIPPAGSSMFVSYAVSDGELGGVARNRKWKVTGFSGAFGINPDPIVGGGASSGSIEDRREARRRSRDDHALVSANDIAAAAKALPHLQVARAWVTAPGKGASLANVVTVVAMRGRFGERASEQPPESARWLEAIRESLAPRMPLGAHLIVAAPRYVPFRIEAVLEAHSGKDPEAVKEEVQRVLGKRLALVDTAAGSTPRRPGEPVTRRDVAAWMLATEGVRRITALRLPGASGKSQKIEVPRRGLPDWDAAGSSIEVQRPAPGRAP